MEKNQGLLSDIIDFQQIKDWVNNNRLLLFFVFTALCLSLTLLYRTRFRSDEKGLLAEREYREYLTSKNHDSLEKLILLVEKNPKLKRNYDAKIARALIEVGQEEKARPFMKRILTFLQEESPHYASFAKTTQLIGQNAWEMAVDEASKLKLQLMQNDRVNPQEKTLYAFNQLRIALLSKKLGNKDQELQAWNDLQKHLTLDESNSNDFLSLFKENGITLKEYIANRIQMLSDSP